MSDMPNVIYAGVTDTRWVDGKHVKSGSFVTYPENVGYKYISAQWLREHLENLKISNAVGKAESLQESGFNMAIDHVLSLLEKE